MRTMKDSGVEWIGEIPSDWEYTKLKLYYRFEKGKNAAIYTQDYIGLNKGFYPVYSGQTENNGIMGKINSYDYDLESCVFTTTVGAKVMTPRILSGKFSLSQNCLIMKQFKQADDRFTYYLLLSLFDYEKSLIPSYMQPSLRIEDLKEYSYFIPTYEDQQRMADFLDKKCGKIDGIIEREQVVIEKLKEYKQSVITEAVTKGLKPNVEMKDSGIEWIGKIPKDWKVARLKNMCSKISDGTHFSPETTDFGMPYLTAKDIQGDIINYDNACKISKENYYKLVKDKCNPEYGDVLIVKDGATTGRVGIKMDDEPCVILSSVAMLHPKDTITTSYYLRYIMESQAMQEQIQISMGGSAMPRTTLTKIMEYWGTYPTINEQNEIADFLNNKCAKIDSAISRKQSVIDKLTEYKKSLIYEVVTGKKEV